MPELPEVETVRKTLENQILGEKIKKVEVFYNSMISPSVEEFCEGLIGETLNKISRYGKYLIFIFNNVSIISHLRMEGKFFLKNVSDERVIHEHVLIHFESGRDLRYHDTRKFGIMKLCYSTNLEEIMKEKELSCLGPEANCDNIPKEYLFDKIKNSNKPIKTLLLDQSIICGIGNIYADEICYYCKINPLMLGKNLSLYDCERILKVSVNVLSKAIECGGTTIRSYTSSLGVTGRFQVNLMVHQRENEPCKKCGAIIPKIVVGGRGTYYCPECQKRIGKVYGITGTIGSGKTTISDYLISHGYKVIDADKINHELLNNEQTIKDLRNMFGETIIENGNINRKALGNIIYNDDEKNKMLKDYLHPLIKNAIINKITKSNEEIIFIDVPLLFESGFADLCKKTICVTCDDDLVVKRICERDNCDKEYALKIISRQMDKKEKITKADYVIDNSFEFEKAYKEIDKILSK